jgi:alcohol dehydrogenase (cytochrome c)
MKSLQKILFGSVAMCLVAGPALAQQTAPTPGGQTVENFEPVTDEMLANPDAADWPSYGRGLDNYRYSPLDQITTENVGQLQLVWARAMEPGYLQIAPLEVNGVIYMGNPGDVIQAIDATDGTLIWEYRRALPDTTTLAALGERKRGIAIYGDKVYFVSWDNFVVALDATTGQLAWETDRGQATDLISNSTGPVVANGIVMAGSTCQHASMGCYVTGHDAATGEELWRNTFIPRPGEEGDETWGNPYESRWMTGVWGQLTYDPDLDLVFYGTSATGPASEVQRGTVGGTQYGTNTRFAVRPQTGEVVWRHQVLPRDNWDQECTFEMITVETPVNPSPDMEGLQAIGAGVEPSDEPRTVLTGVPCKTGTMWTFDAETGEFLWARDTNFQDIIDNIDDTGLVTVNEDKILATVGEPVLWCPSHNGGRDWPPSSYNPETNIFFIPLNNLCQESTPLDQEFTALDVYNVGSVRSLPEGETNAGRIDAINVETGETVWSWETTADTYSPTMITAGNLLFTGGLDRYFRAINQETGEEIWRTRLASQAQGHAITYEVDGRQYVAIPAGGGGGTVNLAATPGNWDGITGANAIYVFALPETE